MNETAQIILMVGVAAFLVLFAGSGVIWSLRSDPAGANYKFPMALGIGAPAVIGMAFLFQRIL